MMSARMLAACLVLLVSSGSAVAADARASGSTACETFQENPAAHAPADRATLNARVVCLTVNAAFAPAAPRDERRLLAMLLLMSAQRANGHGR